MELPPKGGRERPLESDGRDSGRARHDGAWGAVRTLRCCSHRRCVAAGVALGHELRAAVGGRPGRHGLRRQPRHRGGGRRRNRRPASLRRVLADRRDHDGTVALVARATGAGESAQASRVLSASLLLAGGPGVLLVPGAGAATALVGAFGAEPGVVAVGASYLSTLLFGSLPFALVLTLSSALRGAGDVRTRS